MTAIKNFIIKVASRCNLNCSYCYVYNKGDFTFNRQPRFMKEETVDMIIERVQLHVMEHQLDYVHFIFHGGEPLLEKKQFFIDFINKCKAKFKGDSEVLCAVQTNGVLLDDEWCQLFRDLDISVGISFDGPEDLHNKYRVYHSGKGSFRDVMRGMQVLKQYQPLSVINVVNIDSNPHEIYDLVKAQGITDFNLLLPDATYDAPEPQMNFDRENNEAPFGNWLAALYDIWKQDVTGNRPGIPFFESIIRIILGERSGNALIGNNINDVLVIQTDGSYESPLKIGIDGYGLQGMSIFDTSIDEVAETALVNLYTQSHFNLPDECSHCPVNHICGGGLVSHRFSTAGGFNNPSVYCKDLMRIITHIQNDVVNSLPQELREGLELEPITYEAARYQLKENCQGIVHS